MLAGAGEGTEAPSFCRGILLRSKETAVYILLEGSLSCHVVLKFQN